MASLSSKKTAAANAKTLQELHIISAVVNLLVWIGLFLLGRPASKWKYFVLSVPAFASEFVLEKSGRPVHTSDPVTGLKRLVKSGDDIKGPGLFEYMFDCIYITWLCDLLMLVFGSNKVWFLYLVVPGYVAYKVSSLARSFMGKSSKSSQAPESKADSQAAPAKSKRQAKMEQRGQKTRVRTR